MLAQAWVVTCGVDVVACYLVGRVIFGRHPAVPFLLLLAMASDAMGLAVIATVNPVATIDVARGLGLVALGVGLAIVMRRRGVASFWAYLLVPGGLSWCGLFLSGLHPALALVPIMPFMPHARRDVGLFVDPPPHAQDSLSRFERWWAMPVQGVLFLFGAGERRRAAAWPRSRHLGSAGRHARRAADWHPRRRSGRHRRRIAPHASGRLERTAGARLHGLNRCQRRAILRVRRDVDWTAQSSVEDRRVAHRSRRRPRIPRRLVARRGPIP